MARYIDADQLKTIKSIQSANFNSIETIREWIDAQPTTDVKEVRHGKWEVVDETEPRRYGCSWCKCLSWTADNYCPNCGARMDK